MRTCGNESVAMLEVELTRDLLAHALPTTGAGAEAPLALLMARSSELEPRSARYSSSVFTCIAETTHLWSNSC